MTNTAPMRQAAQLSDLTALPATMTIWEAGRLGWGLSRAMSYQLAAAGTFPCPVQRLGTRYVVRASDLLRALGIDVELLMTRRPAASAEAIGVE